MIDHNPYMTEQRERDHRAAVEAHGKRADAAVMMIGVMVAIALLAGWLA